MTGAPTGPGDAEHVPGSAEQPPEGGSEQPGAPLGTSWGVTLPADEETDTSEDALAAALEEQLAAYATPHPAQHDEPLTPLLDPSEETIQAAQPVPTATPGFYEPPPMFEQSPLIAPPSTADEEAVAAPAAEPPLDETDPAASRATLYDRIMQESPTRSALDELQERIRQQTEAGLLGDPAAQPVPTATPGFYEPPSAFEPPSGFDSPSAFEPPEASPPPPPAPPAFPPPPPASAPPPPTGVMPSLDEIAKLPPPVGIAPAAHVPPPPMALAPGEAVAPPPVFPPPPAGFDPSAFPPPAAAPPPEAAVPPPPPPLVVPTRRVLGDPFAEEDGPATVPSPVPEEPSLPQSPGFPEPPGFPPPGDSPAAEEPADQPAEGGDAVPFAGSVVAGLDRDDPEDDAVDDIDRVDRAEDLAALLSEASAVSAAGSLAAEGGGGGHPSDPLRRLPGALEIERAGLEPTPLDRRAARSSRLFWLWFAPNASVVILGIGALLAGSGISLRQAIVAALAGIAVAFLPLGLGTLAGKWSGQPVMVVSRAVFGHLGNLLPALVSLAVRGFWAAALIWLFASTLARLLVVSGLGLALDTGMLVFLGLVLAAAVVALVAVVGYGLLAVVNLVATVVSAVLIAGLFALTASRLDVSAALEVRDGPWLTAMAGAVLVFSLVGVAWTQSTGDLARYQRAESWGGGAMLWATFGATLPALALIVWGALLGASDPVLGAALAADPVGALAGILPGWYPAPLLAALGLGMITAAILSVYSGGFALQALGIRLPRVGATLVVALLAVSGALVFSFLVADPGVLFRDLATTLAVPVSAWLGVFAAEMMIRSRGFSSGSLLERGGIYPDLRWGNVLVLVGASFVGFGLSSAELPGLSWQGFLFRWSGMTSDTALLTSDIGIPLALLLAFMLSFASARPSIRRQEAAQTSAIPVVQPAS